MNKYFKSAMFFTSFLPLWITILFINLMSIINKEKHLYSEYISSICILVGLLISTLIIMLSIKNLKNTDYKDYKITEVSQEKGITSEFLLSYILPLFAFDFTRWESIIQFLIYFCILSFLCIRNNNVYANILLEIRNYKFYTCELVWASEPHLKPIQVIAISNKNLCANKGNTIECASLNKPFYIVK